MKKGDIVVCVDCTRAGYDYQTLYDNDFLFWDDDAIRIGSQYEVLGTFKNGAVMFITIFNDKGTICDYRGTRFKPLSEWREEKLNELGL